MQIRADLTSIRTTLNMWKKVVFLTAMLTVTYQMGFSSIEFIEAVGRNRKATVFGCSRKELAETSKLLSEKNFESNWISRLSRLDGTFFHKSRHIFLVNLNCPETMRFFKQAQQWKLFASPFRWIAFHQATKTPLAIEKTFRNLSILVDSDFNLVTHRNNGEISYRKIYKKRINESTFEVEDFGLWRQNRYFDKQTSSLNDRKNLGTVLKACIVITHNDSLNHLEDKRDKHIDSIAKVNYVLALTMASIYNISLNFSVTNTWGYKDNNSQWNGMMGELVRREADIGGTSLFLLKERIDLIEYIAMISPTRSKFVFRQPKLSYVTNVYTLPFDNRVWLSTVVLVFIMVVVLYFLRKWEFSKIKQQELLHKTAYPDVVFITIGAVCQQGAATLPHSVPGRIATLWLFVSLMFIYVSYSANIVALLQTSSNSIRTLEDLLKSRIPIGVDDTIFNHFFFTTTQEPTRRALYEKKVAPPGKPSNFLSIEEGVRRMRQGLFAFHMETGAGYKIVGETFTEDEKCGLQEIQFLQVVDPWLAIQKNSSYQELLKIGFHLLRETGIQQRENNLIYTKKPSCSSKSSTFFSVGLVDCYPAVLIFAEGLAAGLALLLLELYIHKKFSNHRG